MCPALCYSDAFFACPVPGVAEVTVRDVFEVPADHGRSGSPKPGNFLNSGGSREQRESSHGTFLKPRRATGAVKVPHRNVSEAPAGHGSRGGPRAVMMRSVAGQDAASISAAGSKTEAVRRPEPVEIFEFRVFPEEDGMRLDQVVAGRAEMLSRSAARKLITGGGVKLDDITCCKCNTRVTCGDRISVEIPEEEKISIEPENIPLDIYYEDDDVIVINKPRGMVVHPAEGNYSGTIVNALLYHTGGRLSHVNGEMRPGIVHRIDKDTSGLIMCAVNDRAHEFLAGELRDHNILRKYIALVRDNIKEDEGTIDVPIGRDPETRIRRAVHGTGEKPAVTRYRVLERFGSETLVECRLETGRTHQIRVHMAWIRHPLVGDPLYGRRSENGEGQYLHACVLGFTHPSTGEFIKFEAPLPPYFEDALKKLRNRAR